MQVGNIPTSGTVKIRPKPTVANVDNFNSIKSDSGLKLVNALPNKEKISAATILKQPNININVGDLSSNVIKNLSAATIEKAGTGGLLSFIDPVTSAIGKYGADAVSLINNGFVRPEAFFNGELANSRMWTGKLGIDGLNAFLGAGNIQEDLFLTDVVDDYQNAVFSGAIQNNDDESTIAGMVMVARAANAEVAGDFRQGRTIEPKPIIGTVNITSDTDMNKELTSWYQKGVSAANMAGTTDNLGYTDKWYSYTDKEDLSASWA